MRFSKQWNEFRRYDNNENFIWQRAAWSSRGDCTILKRVRWDIFADRKGSTGGKEFKLKTREPVCTCITHNFSSSLLSIPICPVTCSSRGECTSSTTQAALQLWILSENYLNRRKNEVLSRRSFNEKCNLEDVRRVWDCLLCSLKFEQRTIREANKPWDHWLTKSSRCNYNMKLLKIVNYNLSLVV